MLSIDYNKKEIDVKEIETKELEDFNKIMHDLTLFTNLVKS